jgi:hypothetical protein
MEVALTFAKKNVPHPRSHSEHAMWSSKTTRIRLTLHVFGFLFVSPSKNLYGLVVMIYGVPTILYLVFFLGKKFYLIDNRKRHCKFPSEKCFILGQPYNL